jgi:heme exporter protein A
VTSIIEVRNLIKRFGHKQVLRKLNFSVQQGEFVALLGSNGAGKTTLLRILSSLSKPNYGEIQIAGYSLPGQSAQVRKKLGVVSHLPLLYGDLSAEENLKFYGRLYGLSDFQNHVEEILQLVGLLKRKKDLVRTFSRGMQQRLAIGRAIIHDPEVLLLDEPHTGLDQDAANMLDTLLQEIASRGRTVVMTSHDFPRVANLATRFDVLYKGKIHASKLAKDLPQHGLLAYYQSIVDEIDAGGGNQGAA